MVEETVVHPKFGRGIVKRKRHRGLDLQVEFENGVTRWVRSDELVSTEPSRVEPTKGYEIKLISDERLRARRIIEALRLGIVPYDCVEDFTFGREAETEAITTWLETADESSIFVVGQYGAGKTHLLHYACGIALRKGYAVAWVEMDPNEAPFHKPKRVYNRLVTSFRYRSPSDGRLRNFRAFLREVLGRHALRDHLYFRLLGQNPQKETVWLWIEGNEASLRPVDEGSNWIYALDVYSSFPPLYNYSTAANIYTYLLSGMGWAASEVLGLRGLLLIFDEAETISISQYQYQMQRGKNFIEALLSVADNEEDLLKHPERSTLDYCKKGLAQNIPFLYRKPSGLKLLFAFTDVQIQTRYRIVQINPLSDDVLRQIFENICLLYSEAYDYTDIDVMMESIYARLTDGGGRTRAFVKGSVEALDLSRLKPEGKPQVE